MMNCEQATELLPWLLNGAMDEVEQRPVKEHIATCLRCRQELAGIRSGWIVYQSHVPADALVDYAFRRPVANPQPEEIERHLAMCDECAEQLEMARESYNWASSEEPEPAPKRKIRWWEVWRWRDAALAASGATVSETRRSAIRWQYATLATSLVALIAIGGWLWSSRGWQTSSTARQRAAEERMANLEADNQRLRESEAQSRQRQDETNQLIAQLQKKVEESSSPQINIPLLYVQPSDPLIYKSGDRTASRPVELRIPPGAKSVILILNSQTPDTSRSYRIEMLDAQKAVRWSASGLARSTSNDYTINLPAEFLASGASYTFNVYGESKGRSVKVESYRIRVK